VHNHVEHHAQHQQAEYDESEMSRFR